MCGILRWAATAGPPKLPWCTETGGDPRTGHASFKTETGGDPKTDLHVPSGGEVKTDQHVPSGGEVKTDQVSLDVQMTCFADEMVYSPLPGRGWQPKLPLLILLPALIPRFRAQSAKNLLMDSRRRIFQLFPMDFPSISEGSESRDELPRSGVICQVEAGPMNSISDNTSTVFSLDFHVGEKSERLRESDFGVQIVPGTVRLESEPISIDPTSTLVFWRFSTTVFL